MFIFLRSGCVSRNAPDLALIWALFNHFCWKQKKKNLIFSSQILYFPLREGNMTLYEIFWVHFWFIEHVSEGNMKYISFPGFLRKKRHFWPFVCPYTSMKKRENERKTGRRFMKKFLPPSQFKRTCGYYRKTWINLLLKNIIILLSVENP